MIVGDGLAGNKSLGWVRLLHVNEFVWGPEIRPKANLHKLHKLELELDMSCNVFANLCHLWLHFGYLNRRAMLLLLL